MKKAGQFVWPLLLLISCNTMFLGDDPGHSAIDTFDEFWKGVDETWPAFSTKRINWDSLYQVYRPQVTVNSNEADLMVVLKNLLYPLKDSHTSIYPKNLPAIQYYPNYPPNFYGFTWIVQRYHLTYKGNAAIGYGLIQPDVGYIYISNFSNASGQYGIIDQILAEFANVKGIIIDVRNNTGGNSNNSMTIASRFADGERTYSYSRFRTGHSKNILGDFIPEIIKPSGGTLPGGKVAVLTNLYSYSATEDFMLMMKSFPQVIQLGDPTGGGSESRPIIKELPNGWYYRVASKLVCGPDKQPIGKGVMPDLLVQTTKADSLNGKDTIIERAIFELLK